MFSVAFRLARGSDHETDKLDLKKPRKYRLVYRLQTIA